MATIQLPTGAALSSLTLTCGPIGRSCIYARYGILTEHGRAPGEASHLAGRFTSRAQDVLVDGPGRDRIRALPRTTRREARIVQAALGAWFGACSHATCLSEEVEARDSDSAIGD